MGSAATGGVRRARVVVALVVALALAACSSGGGGERDRALRRTTTAPRSTTTTRPATTATTTEVDPADLSRISLLLQPSVALIETPYGWGSGLVLGDGYVVTNAHVVEPWASVMVTVGDHREPDLVPVVGVDLAADLAVVGPIKVAAPGVTFADPAGLPLSTPLFSAGFPAKGDEPVFRVDAGVLVTHRELPDWSQHYLVTTAEVHGGESGGPLVDGQGRVVAIDGMTIGDQAVSLAAPDVQALVADIRAGGGDPRPVVDTAGTLTDVDVHLASNEEVRTLVLAPADHDRTVDVALSDPTARVATTDVDGYVYDTSDTGKDFYADANEGFAEEDDGGGGTPPADEDEDPTVVKATTPGVYRFDVAAYEPTVLEVGVEQPAGAPLHVHTSLPFSVLSGDPVDRPLVAGRNDGIVDKWAADTYYTVSLRKGQHLQLEASAAQADIGVTIIAPGQVEDDGDTYEDTVRKDGASVLEVDHEAKVEGTYRIYVYEQQGFSTAYHLDASGF